MVGKENALVGAGSDGAYALIRWCLHSTGTRSELYLDVANAEKLILEIELGSMVPQWEADAVPARCAQGVRGWAYRWTSSLVDLKR